MKKLSRILVMIIVISAVVQLVAGCVLLIKFGDSQWDGRLSALYDCALGIVSLPIGIVFLKSPKKLWILILFIIYLAGVYFALPNIPTVILRALLAALLLIYFIFCKQQNLTTQEPTSAVR